MGHCVELTSIASEDVGSTGERELVTPAACTVGRVAVGGFAARGGGGGAQDGDTADRRSVRSEGPWWPLDALHRGRPMDPYLWRDADRSSGCRLGDGSVGPARSVHAVLGPGSDRPSGR